MGCPVRGNVRVHACSHCQDEGHSITPPGDVDNFGEDNLSGLLCFTGRKYSDEEDDTARNADQKECNLCLWQLTREEHRDGSCERLVQDVQQVDLPLSCDKVFMPERSDRNRDLGTHNCGAGREETIANNREPAHDESHSRPRAFR